MGRLLPFSEHAASGSAIKHKARVEATHAAPDVVYDPLDAEDIPGMPASAVAKWQELTAVMAGKHVLTVADKSLLVATCMLHHSIGEMESEISVCGMTSLNDKGAVQKNPLITSLLTSRTLYLRHLEALGLTPASRTKVRVAAPAEDAGNPFSGFTK